MRKAPDPRLPTRALAQATAAMRRICGIEEVTIGVVDRLGRTPTTASTAYLAEFTGWSPSLHRARCLIEVRCDPADPDFAETLAASFTAHMGVQRRRLEAAIALDMIAPLPVKGLDEHDMETGHMLVDRALVAMCVERGEDPAARIASALRHAHAQYHDATSATLEEVEGVVSDTTHGRVVGFPMRLEGEWDDAGATFDGMTLTLRGVQLPETVCCSLPGRRLGDVASIHSALDDRRIVAMETSRTRDDEIVMALDMDLTQCPMVGDDQGHPGDGMETRKP